MAAKIQEQDLAVAVPQKVAIVGSGTGTRNMAPWEDTSWEIWGMGPHHNWVPRWNRWFHLHPRENMEPDVPWMRAQTAGQIFLPEAREDIPQSVRFPREELLEHFGKEFEPLRPPFTCSPAWQLALAILWGVPHVALWGIDLSTQKEYGHQKEGMAYFVGYARGRGIRVDVPPQSDLLKCLWEYGYTQDDPFLLKLHAQREEIHERIDRTRSQIEDLKGQLFQLRGMDTLSDWFEKNWAQRPVESPTWDGARSAFRNALGDPDD